MHGRTVANSAGMLMVMEHHRDHIRASDDCPTCRRRFASDQEKASTLQMIDSDIMVGDGVCESLPTLRYAVVLWQ